MIYFFFEKVDKTVKSTFWLFNLCNGEKTGKIYVGTNAIKPCRVFSLRPSVSICSVSAKNVHFGASLTWTILTTSLQPFWALKMSVALLSMQGQKDLEFHTKYLNLCSLRSYSLELHH